MNKKLKYFLYFYEKFILFFIIFIYVFQINSAHSAPTDIATAPLNYLISSKIKPNIMFILDDSSSMAWSFMGDDVVDKNYQNTVGYRSSLCNKIYYNPNIKYTVPVMSDGSAYAVQNFNSALYDGYQPLSLKVDLGVSFMAWRSNKSNLRTPSGSGTVEYTEDCESLGDSCAPDSESQTSNQTLVKNQREPAYYFIYKGNGLDNLRDNSSRDHCKDKLYDTSNSGSHNWIKIVVGDRSGPGSTDERENFANWYSYYRTRMLLMKTAVGHAFHVLDQNYRVGFSTIGYSGTDSTSSYFEKIAEFNSVQKSQFYNKLYGTRIGSGTPLRAALAKAGRIYAGKLLTGDNDPLQYSCQRNYSILSTDGYWNTTKETISYGPNLIAEDKNVGNQDSNLSPPKKEGVPPTSNTLADVAAYYFQTDLRTTQLNNCLGDKNVCENNVPVVAGSEGTNFQQMITFTLGLGANGTLRYQENYEQAVEGDFKDIKTGKKNWPDPLSSDGAERIDDLWHAAVNGGGKYFSAQNSEALTAALSGALQAIRVRVSTAAAAATSSQEPIEGDNILYASQYRSVHWDGDLNARSINMTDGTVSNTALWSAQNLLDQRSLSSGIPRKIYLYATNRVNKIKEFYWSQLSISEKNLFNSPCAPQKKLSQCNLLNTSQANLAGGENLVNYLRGSTNFEDRIENPDRYFRRREHVLGALINARPVYVSKPAFRYADDNYAGFRDEQQVNRKKMIYAAANDGMLHAFNATNGHEEWAFIPPAVLPELIKLADFNLATTFRYLLDGSPVVGDICSSAPASQCDKTQWRTILVGGLAGGGRQYYALDITDPDNPKALWVYGVDQDPNLGYTHGKPLITKRVDGRWVVVFTSGYNNISPGDGMGYLYVVDATTGMLLEKISTNSGSVETPSGLAQINSWVDSPFDNTARRYYGGDLSGKLWRFDIDDIVLPSGKEAIQLASFVKNNIPQPITSRPELSEIQTASQKIPIISLATGKYLGMSDIEDINIQSIYTFKDTLSATGLGNLSGSASMVMQTLTNINNATQRTTSQLPIDWSQKNGWAIDLAINGASTGERVTLDIEQQLGILRVISIIPSRVACVFGGQSWIYTFDYRNGRFLPAAENQAAGKKISSTMLITGSRTIKWRDRTASILTDESGQITKVEDPMAPAYGSGLKRVSWRELDEQ